MAATQQQRTATAPRPELTGIRRAGDRAILVELSSLDAVLSLQAQLTAHPQPGQIDVIAAASTVLVTADSAQAVQALAAHVRGLDLEAPADTESALVTIDVVYDGEDLDEVASLTGLGREGVVAAHAGQLWTAAFAGFAPGFAYLSGENPSLEVPRRRSPRTAVPAGAVALGGAYSAVYPRQSPGGWQLIGRTEAAMWDLDRENPALIRPGDTVRFKAVRNHAIVTERPKVPANRTAEHQGHAGLAVRKPGLQATVQDLGRPGFASLGVSSAGAMDRGALRRANRLVGNAEGAAGIELLFGGLELEALTDQVLAVAGAPVPLQITPGEDSKEDIQRTTAARHPACDAPFALLAGERLTVGTPTAGLRSYIGVRGGLGGPDALGSRSTDTMSGIGPELLEAGTILPVHAAKPGSVVGHPEVSPPSDSGRGNRAAGGPRTPAGLVQHRHAAGLPGPGMDRHAKVQPDRTAPQRPAAQPQPGRRTRQRRNRPRRRAGAAGRPARPVPLRPPGDRRVPGDCRRRPCRPGQGRPASPGHNRPVHRRSSSGRTARNT